MRKRLVAAGVFLLLTAALGACYRNSSPTAPRSLEPSAALQSVSAAAQSKTDICHLNDEGLFQIVSIADPAIEAHLAHGDHAVLALYADADGDGFGTGASVSGCEVPQGFADSAGDCDDARSDTYPGAAEICGDGVDNDCDGEVDEACSAVSCPCETESGSIGDLTFTSSHACSDSGSVVSFGGSGYFDPLARSVASTSGNSCHWKMGPLTVGQADGYSDAEAQACHQLVRQQAAATGVSCP